MSRIIKTPRVLIPNLQSWWVLIGLYSKIQDEPGESETKDEDDKDEKAKKKEKKETPLAAMSDLL